MVREKKLLSFYYNFCFWVVFVSIMKYLLINCSQYINSARQYSPEKPEIWNFSQYFRGLHIMLWPDLFIYLFVFESRAPVTWSSVYGELVALVVNRINISYPFLTFSLKFSETSTNRVRESILLHICKRIYIEEKLQDSNFMLKINS